MAHERSATEPAPGDGELISRLRRGYDAAYWGYVYAREERSEPRMVWWGTRVVQIRELLDCNGSPDAITTEVVERFEQELRNGPSSKK